MTNALVSSKYRVLSGSMLKILAILCMAIDHGALILYPVIDALRIPFSILGKSVTLYWVLRRIGRLAFPIFCFLIAEGFQHTHSKKKYGLRLLIFAFLSEIPFDLMRSGRIFDLSGQNVFFTLFLGLLFMYAYETIDKEWKRFLSLGLTAIAAVMLRVDYGVEGAILVFAMYLFRSQPAVQALIAYPLLSRNLCAFAALIPINLYNGKRGFINSPALKLAFYIFYPAHILILLGIKYLLK